jgi:hypothetical protein
MAMQVTEKPWLFEAVKTGDRWNLMLDGGDLLHCEPLCPCWGHTDAIGAHLCPAAQASLARRTGIQFVPTREALDRLRQQESAPRDSFPAWQELSRQTQRMIMQAIATHEKKDHGGVE